MRRAAALGGIVLAGVGCEVVLGLNVAERASEPIEQRTVEAGGRPAITITIADASVDEAAASVAAADAGGPATSTYNDSQFVVSSLKDHTCTVGPDQRAYCWGDNTYGQVGDSTVSQRNAPVRVAPTFDDVVDISAGYTHSCLVRGNTGGDVYCWGKNDRGQLGDGTKDDRHDPTTKLSMSGALKVGVGGWHTCALTKLQGVRCWGDNYYGALGDGTFTASTTYVDVKGLSQVTSLAVGVMHNCAVTQQGKVYCWGRAVFGEVGYPVDGNNGSPDPGDYGSPTATEVPGLSGITEVVAGEDHTCAIRNDGAILCWGRNDYAEFGDGKSDAFTSTPTRTILGDGGVPPYPIHLSAGGFTTCGVFSGGLPQCWGDNAYGQLGNGDVAPGPDWPSPDIVGLKHVVHLATNQHTCAFLQSAGSTPPWKIFCFGRNDLGQVGIGHVSDNELVPQEVMFPTSTPRNGP